MLPASEMSGRLDQGVISFHRRVRKIFSTLPQHLSNPTSNVFFCFCVLTVAEKVGCVERRGALDRIALENLGFVFTIKMHTFKEHGEKCYGRSWNGRVSRSDVAANDS